MLGSMLGGAYFRSPSCRRLQSRGSLGLRPYTALRTIAADVGPQNAGLDCASNWLASTGKSTLAVERARRAGGVRHGTHASEGLNAFHGLCLKGCPACPLQTVYVIEFSGVAPCALVGRWVS